MPPFTLPGRNWMSVANIPSAIALLVAGLVGCTEKKTETPIQSYVDTTVAVYGPYLALKLPIRNGVAISNPIQLAPGPDGVMYAANATGEVYSLRDSDGDGIEDTNLLFCDVKEAGLRSPGGFAFRGDTIYIGTAQQIRAYIDTDKDGTADSSWVFFDDIPTSEHPYEWTSGLVFGTDGSLYCALTTDSWNAGASPDPKGYRGAILKIAPDGKSAQVVATGIRSVYGMTFSPDQKLYFVDNEGGGNANEELNVLVENAFYGHNPKKYSFDSIMGPVLKLQTELAPSELEFNRSDNDFGGTAGNLFISYYGPGERWTRGGIGRVEIQRNADGTVVYKEHAVADIPKLSNLAFGKDGALYLAQHGKADYWYNPVYENEGSFFKLVYDPSLRESSSKPRMILTAALTEGSVEKGRQLFAERACAACHAVDGETELLGPNLKGVTKQFSRAELLEEIEKPSERIKPSMGATRITKHDGKVLLGRVVTANENEISLMLVGNQVVQIPRHEIRKTEDQKQSLMYEGLLANMSDEDRTSLLDYLESLSE
jgi:putative heme-binding domain-containing protein